MNQSYKTIFSKVHQCSVVVSELAKSQGKGSRTSRLKKTAVTLLAATAFGGLSGQVWAAPSGEGATIQGIGVTVAETGASAWGNKTTADGIFSTAFGDSTKAKGISSTAFGSGTTASGNFSTAFGGGAKASGNFSTAFGDNTTIAGGDYSTAFGGSSQAFGDNSLAALGGRTGGGSIEVSTSGEVIVNRVDGKGDGAVAVGEGAVAEKSYTYAIGQKAQATAENTLALGNQAVASKKNSIAIGTGAEASGEQSFSIGNGNKVSGNNSGAFGDPNTVSGDGSYAVGNNNTVSGSGSYAIGNNNTIEVNDGFVLGSDASVTAAGGVALGKGSVASMDKGVAGYDPSARAASNSELVEWKSTDAAVSVGNANGSLTRQITGVAAGYRDTDAVNVAQLKAVAAVDGNIKNMALMVSGDAEKTITLTDSYNNTVTAEFTDKDTTYTAGENIEIIGTEIRAIDTNTQSTVKHAESSMDYLTVTSEDNNIGTKDYTVALTEKANTAIGNANTFLDSGGFKAGNVTVTNQGFTAGNVTVTNQGFTVQGGPSMTTKGIDAGGKKITNVANGTEANDAVNYSQLQQLDQKLAHRDAQLERKIYRAGAHAAAIAALHPLDYDEDHKFTAAAGVGQYHGSSAMAVGAFYRPTENLMFSVGASLNENDSMVNAGMAYRFGTGSGNKTSPNNIHEMKRQISTLSEENRQLSAQLNSSETKLAAESERSARLEAEISKIKKLLKLK